MMTSKEELEKMTVAQIREKLKSRKLPTTGTKSELVVRLHESIVAEEKLLEEGPGGENIDLSNVNMDEVLGLDDDKDPQSIDSSDNTKQNESLLSSSSALNDDSFIDGGDKPTAAKTVLNVLSPEKKTSPSKVNQVTTQPKKSTEDKPQESKESAQPEQNKEKEIPLDEDKKVQLKTAARLGVPLGESEAKAKRAIRFGGSGSIDEEDQKAKRQARFGTVVEEAKRKPTSEDDEKMLKRAERFGLPLKRGAAADSSSSTDQDALGKRAKRFGLEGGNEDLKKAARAKRFEMAS